MSVGTPPEISIRSQLDRILAHPSFSGSERLSRFLRFAVERTLAGQGEDLKEYPIATEVYGRPADFDPRTDSIVRVEASRLRTKLRDYYEVSGREDPVVIRLPKGSDTPAFESRETGPAAVAAAATTTPPAPSPATREERRRRRSWRPLAAVAVALIAGVGGWWIYSTQRSQPPRFDAIGVLPFVNLSGEPAVESFADGITEEVTAELAKLAGLRVPGRTTTQLYKGKAIDISKAGRELRVGALLEGSVRYDGRKYRITAQLINVEDGYHVWAETFERDGADPLSLQKDVSERIARALRERVEGQRAWRTAGLGAPSSQSLQFFIEAKDLLKRDPRKAAFTRGLPQNLVAAIERLDKVTAAESGFAQAWTYLAIACEFAISYDRPNAAQYHAKAEAALRKAIALDETLAEAHTSLGEILFFRNYDLRAAETHWRRAIEIDPRDANLQRLFADLMRVTGRPEQAEREMRRALELGTHDADLETQYGLLMYDQRRYDEAIGRAQRALTIEADNRVAHWLIGLCFEQKGKLKEAEAKYRHILAAAPTDGRGLPALGYVLGRMGRTREALEIAAELTKMHEGGRTLSYPIALVYA
ncbi:MAG: tetratricopeptide repeat protein, partial [Bryobacteraceae bacterium]